MFELNEILNSQFAAHDNIHAFNFPFYRSMNTQLISESSEVELGEVCLHPDIEKILSDKQWINDAIGLMPHCLAILKLCHLLTNRIIALTMANISQHRKNNLESFVQVILLNNIFKRVTTSVYSYSHKSLMYCI